MANTIKAETGKLRAASSSFSSASTQIKGLIGNMINEIAQINGSSIWMGDAATAYNRKFNELNDGIRNIDKMIQEYVKDLNAIAQEYDKAESENRQAAESLAKSIF